MPAPPLRYGVGVSNKAVVFAIVVPFVALCALGLWWTTRRLTPPALAPEQPAERSVGTEETPPSPSTLTPRPSRPPERAAPPEPPPSRSADALPHVVLLESTALTPSQRADAEAALAVLQPVLHQCFEDDGGRFRGERRLDVRFAVTPQDRRAQRPQLGGAPLADPLLAACLEDVFAEVKLPSPRSEAAFEVAASLRFSSRATPGGIR